MRSGGIEERVGPNSQWVGDGQGQATTVVGCKLVVRFAGLEGTGRKAFLFIDPGTEGVNV